MPVDGGETQTLVGEYLRSLNTTAGGDGRDEYDDDNEEDDFVFGRQQNIDRDWRPATRRIQAKLGFTQRNKPARGAKKAATQSHNVLQISEDQMNEFGLTDDVFDEDDPNGMDEEGQADDSAVPSYFSFR